MKGMVEKVDYKNVAILTLGCKVNQYETNAMAQKLQQAGYSVTEITSSMIDESIDIFIVNTCTVTNIADRKSRQQLRKIKEYNPHAIVVATGCYAQVSREVLEQMPEIDLILGNNEKKEIVKYIEEFLSENEKITHTENLLETREFSDLGSVTYTEKSRAAVKVQDGCDRFCSYCIIPYARGRVRSRKPESIVSEISEISKKGIKEVVITGIHIASYGKDFKEDYKLIDLLEEIQKIEGIERIRLGSIEPLLITDEFVKRLSKLDKICHHFHLSLQSGCDETLARMNRRYGTEDFIKVVERLRNTYSDVILTTDIIVGFPGETDEEFEKTYEFLTKIKFYKMHVFPYSRRQGTKAADMKNQIDGNVKDERSKKLIDLSNKNEQEYNTSYVGKVAQVLVEEKVGENIFQGHTGNYLMVKIKLEDHKYEQSELENKIVNVKIVGCEDAYLIGEISINI
ncbi:MAG: tRNA (N(6)-L-threonylcarbamoyladenosine(37)-C(2))-methylthiotransferase MtaB [Clostridia bacterium]|nr:tRNA (N(6)-L-threonylcarbamoyladenosine(37)-C(2))-methylthiotransferase MtaB [Clostridia bacterium]